MENLILHLVKGAAILSIFFVVYQVFLKKETFYRFNRMFLLSGLLLAFALPLITIPTYIEVDAMRLQSFTGDLNPATQSTAPTVSPRDILFLLYGLGVCFLLMKLGMQLFSLRKVFRNSTSFKKEGFTFVESNENILPFSFFRYIFYNPANFNNQELEAILKHEKAHSSQWHSFDLLLAQFTQILMWANPFSWLYKQTVEQNLEFLADRTAIANTTSSKIYQYTLLKVSGNSIHTSIATNFYNSLIKKRIVMLQKSKSRQRNTLKALLVLPLLALFMLSFNTRTIYVPTAAATLSPMKNPQGQRIELIIDKNTSDEELETMKADLLKKGVDFSYTVVHNENMEIIEIEIDMSGNKTEGKRFQGTSSFDNDGKPIDPITIIYDEEGNTFYAGNSGSKSKMLQQNTHKKVILHDVDETTKVIEINKANGTKVIRINGEEVSEEDVKIIKDIEVDGHTEISIDIDEDYPSSKKIIIEKEEVTIHPSKGTSNLVLETEGRGKMLYMLNGKKISRETFEQLEQNTIERISVYKGDKAVEKYGKKAKHGVVEITTK